VYDTQAIIPLEIGEPYLLRQNFNEYQNQESISRSLNLLMKQQEKAQIRDTRRMAAKKYNSKLQL